MGRSYQAPIYISILYTLAERQRGLRTDSKIKWNCESVGARDEYAHLQRPQVMVMLCIRTVYQRELCGPKGLQVKGKGVHTAHK